MCGPTIRLLLTAVASLLGWADCLGQESESFSLVNGAIRSQQDAISAATAALFERRRNVVWSAFRAEADQFDTEATAIYQSQSESI